MLYYRCPTCKTILADKQLIYEKKLDEICKNVNLTFKEQDIEKKKLFNNLEIPRPCCRMRMMGFVELIDKIK